MFAVLQAYYDSGKIKTLYLNEAETKLFLSNQAQHYTKISKTSYKKVESRADIYVDLFKDHYTARKFYHDCKSA